MSSLLRPWFLFTLLAACTGTVAPDPSPEQAAPATPPMGVTPPPSTSSPPPVSTPSPAACSTPEEPGPSFLRRLTNAEYDRVIGDLLGDTSRPARAFPEDATVDGFDNNAQSIAISAPLVRAYADAARTVASTLVANVSRRDKVMGCALDSAGCVKQFVLRFGRRAFRRPLTTAEQEALVALADSAGSDRAAGVALVIRAVLQSPKFLFLPEIGLAEGARPGLRRLTGHELATRLSFLLWGTSPDDALLDRAGAGGLDTAAGVQETAKLMLKDTRARAGLRRFAERWLGLLQLDDVAPDPARYPAWSTALRASMAEETALLFDDFVWQNRDLRDVLTAPFTYVDRPLAQLYKVPTPTGTALVKVDLPAQGPRLGLLGHASLLTITGQHEAEAPILRGRYIRSVLMCDPLPPPPEDVPPIGDARPGLSDRGRLEAHRSNPACAPCHRKLDPVGFGLARFDGVGALRDKDSTGAPVDDSGFVDGLPGGGAFTGPRELATRLRESDRLGRCAVENLLKYARARSLVAGDACVINKALHALETHGGSFQAALLSIIGGDGFRHLAPQGGTP